MLARTATKQACVRPATKAIAQRRHLHASSRRLNLDPSAPVQSYISTSRDPYLNLSIEHHLLQTSSPESTILFLYTNRPCIVIGRNQNPWVEVNLPLLRATNKTDDGKAGDIGRIDLVRRRSGGGTVFHDEGNLNWSVICPSADFNRDKYAEMVVGALRSLGIDRARVNERHDIVLDQGSTVSEAPTDMTDMHRTKYIAQETDGPRPLKVSGSAYKLTRLRSLHHATCLLSSPHLGLIPQYLRSPARPYISARGVESVSSPVGNIGISQTDFTDAVREQFGRMHNVKINVIDVGEQLLTVTDIDHGYEELKSADWIYGQTPQFELRADPLSLTFRHGLVQPPIEEDSDRGRGALAGLEGQCLYDKFDWETLNTWVAKAGSQRESRSTGWLQEMLEVPV